MGHWTIECKLIESNYVPSISFEKFWVGGGGAVRLSVSSALVKFAEDLLEVMKYKIGTFCGHDVHQLSGHNTNKTEVTRVKLELRICD